MAADVIHTAVHFPGFLFSGYTHIKDDARVLISIENFELFQQMIWESHSRLSRMNDETEFYNRIVSQYSHNVAKISLRMKLDEKKMTNEIRGQLKNGMRNLGLTQTTEIFDCGELLLFIHSATDMLELLSGIVTAVALILTFFLLFISFIANITDNVWEVGVLRALGITKSNLIRIYIYESLSMMFAAGIIGFIVGYFSSFAMAAQFASFAELPFEMTVSVGVLLFVFGCSTMISMVAPYMAAQGVLKKQIASIVKGL
jgi:ABC-type antimicrobial peptide transport system permease subunit